MSYMWNRLRAMFETYRQRLMSMAEEVTGVEDKSSMPTTLVADSGKVTVRGLPKSVAKSVASAVEKEASGGRSGTSGSIRMDVSSIAKGTKPQIGSKTQALLEASKSMRNAKGVEERREVKEQVMEHLPSEAGPSATPRGTPSTSLVAGSGKAEIVSTPSNAERKGASKSSGTSKGIDMNARVPNSVKEKVYKQVKEWLHSLPEWVQDKVDADSLVETIRLASTYGDLMRTVSMINSTVKAVVLSRAKERALNYMKSLPSDVREILSTTGGIYDEYIKKIKEAKSVEELNRIMEDFVREANDYLRSAYARVMNWRKGYTKGMLPKWEEYKDFELSKEKVLEWLESLPLQVKEALGSKYKEIEESVRSASSYKELGEAVKEANEQVREAWLKSKVVLGRSLEMLYPELSKSIVAKFEQYRDFESAKEKVLDYLNSLPDQIKALINVDRLMQEVRNAKGWKDLTKAVEEVDKQVKEAYRSAVRGEALAMNAMRHHTPTMVASVSLGTPPKGSGGKVISEKSRKEINDWINKVGDTLIKAGVWNEFFDKYGKYVKELERTNDPKRARELIDKIRKGAEQILMKHYKERIVASLTEYEKGLKPYERETVGKTVEEFISAVKRAKSLEELREVVREYNRKLEEVGVIVGRGLKGLELPDVVEVWTHPNVITVETDEHHSSTLPPNERGVTLGYLLSPSLAGQAMSQLHVTIVSPTWEEGSIKMFKTFHPTSLSEAIMQEATRSNNLWDRAFGAFLSGLTGATVGMFNPESYYNMYELATNPEYRANFLKEMEQLRVKHPELFWGSLVGTAVGMGLMAGLGRVAGGKELAIQEFEPILQIRRGNLAKGSLTEIGYWKTLAKIPKDEVLEFGKAGAYIKGPGGKLLFKTFKSPQMTIGELFEKVKPSLELGGEIGVVKSKYILPELGEPISVDIEVSKLASTPEGALFEGAKIIRPRGLGGKVAESIVVRDLGEYTVFTKVKGYKLPGRLGVMTAEWGTEEGYSLPRFLAKFEGAEGGGAEGSAPVEGESAEIPIEAGGEGEAGDVGMSVEETTLGEGGEGRQEVIEGEQAVELEPREESEGVEVLKGRASRVRVVEEESPWGSVVELVVPSALVGVNIPEKLTGVGEKVMGNVKPPKLITPENMPTLERLVKSVEELSFQPRRLSVAEFMKKHGLREYALASPRVVNIGGYLFEIAPLLMPRLHYGNGIRSVNIPLEGEIEGPRLERNQGEFEGFRYEPRFRYVSPTVSIAPSTLSLNTPSVSTSNTSTPPESTATPPPESVGEGISDINIQGVTPITPPPPNTTPPPNNQQNPPQTIVSPPVGWSPKWRLPTWWYPWWRRRRYARRPNYVLEVLTI